MIQLKYCITVIVLCGIFSKAVAENNAAANYEDGVLTIPRVDTPEQVGNYQSARLQYDANLDVWVLQEVKSVQFSDFYPAIHSVRVSVVNDSFPTQVFINVTGSFGCAEFGQINTRRIDNVFEVQVSVIPYPPDTLCTADIREFSRVIPLDVYRLNAGDYQYTVNGGNSGSFSLANDNKFGECGGTANPEEICEIEQTQF